MENQERREDVYSRAIRAGKRTYFFDVKATKNGQNFITITESKKKFNTEQGKFFFEKHKIFLYKEDFEKFSEGFHDVLDFINKQEDESEEFVKDPIETETVDVSFEDLGSEDKTSF